MGVTNPVLLKTLQNPELIGFDIRVHLLKEFLELIFHFGYYWFYRFTVL
jgi:hypothetical protein